MQDSQQARHGRYRLPKLQSRLHPHWDDDLYQRIDKPL